MVTNGKGMVHAYTDRFWYEILPVKDATPAEVLGHFLHSLAPAVYAQVFVQDPQDFELATLAVEKISGAHREASQGGGTGASLVPMNLSAIEVF